VFLSVFFMAMILVTFDEFVIRVQAVRLF
jgi:hypothetical protein